MFLLAYAVGTWLSFMHSAVPCMSLLLYLFFRSLVPGVPLHMGPATACEAGWQRENRFYAFLQALDSGSSRPVDDVHGRLVQSALSNRSFDIRFMRAAECGSLESELCRSLKRLTQLVGPSAPLPHVWVQPVSIEKIPSPAAVSFTRTLLPFIFWLLGGDKNCEVVML